MKELSQVKGTGLAKASRIKAAFELDKHLESYPGIGKQPVLTNTTEVVSLVQGRSRGKKKEHFMALLMDTRGQLIRIAEVSVESLDSSSVHPREVFKEAISASAASIALAQ